MSQLTNQGTLRSEIARLFHILAFRTDSCDFQRVGFNSLEDVFAELPNAFGSDLCALVINHPELEPFHGRILSIWVDRILKRCRWQDPEIVFRPIPVKGLLILLEQPKLYPEYGTIIRNVLTQRIQRSRERIFRVSSELSRIRHLELDQLRLLAECCTSKREEILIHDVLAEREAHIKERADPSVSRMVSDRKDGSERPRWVI